MLLKEQLGTGGIFLNMWLVFGFFKEETHQNLGIHTVGRGLAGRLSNMF